jgi:hypothetical protein
LNHLKKPRPVQTLAGLRYKNNRLGDVDPDNSYSANLLVDGEWGMMSAGNVLVVARGIMELYNRAVLHAQQGERTVTSRDIIENSDAKRTQAKKTEQQATGGESYLARKARETIKKSSMCCNLQAGLHVHQLTSISSVTSIITRDKVKLYGFNDTPGDVALKQRGKDEQKDKKTIFAWKSVCQGMIREDFESSLDFTSGHAKHVLEKMRPEIGHTAATSRESYLKPPVAVRFQPPSLRGKENPDDRWAVLDLRGSCNTMCTLLSNSDNILKCGDFGINTACECSMAATTYQNDNQKEWLSMLENTVQAVPAIDDGDAEHLLRLASQTKVAVRELFRPIPKLHARWPTNFRKEPYDEGTQNAVYVGELSDSCNMMTNEVVRIVREHNKMPVAVQSPTRLLGVSCCPMMAAKMFGPWAYHFELTDELQYGTYMNRRSPNDEIDADRLVLIKKRRAYTKNQNHHIDVEVAKADLRAKLRAANEKIDELEKENKDLKSTVTKLTEQLAASERSKPTTAKITKVGKGEHCARKRSKKGGKEVGVAVVDDYPPPPTVNPVQEAASPSDLTGDDMLACSVCGGIDSTCEDNDIVLCEKCNSGYHQKCHDPILTEDDKRKELWLCHTCEASETLLNHLNLYYNPNAFYGHDQRCPLHPSAVGKVIPFVDKAQSGNKHHLKTFCDSSTDKDGNFIYWYQHSIVTVFRDGIIVHPRTEGEYEVHLKLDEPMPDAKQPSKRNPRKRPRNSR